MSIFIPRRRSDLVVVKTTGPRGAREQDFQFRVHHHCGEDAAMACYIWRKPGPRAIRHGDEWLASRELKRQLLADAGFDLTRGFPSHGFNSEADALHYALHLQQQRDAKTMMVMRMRMQERSMFRILRPQIFAAGGDSQRIGSGAEQLVELVCEFEPDVMVMSAVHGSVEDRRDTPFVSRRLFRLMLTAYLKGKLDLMVRRITYLPPPFRMRLRPRYPL